MHCSILVFICFELVFGSHVRGPMHLKASGGLPAMVKTAREKPASGGHRSGQHPTRGSLLESGIDVLWIGARTTVSPLLFKKSPRLSRNQRTGFCQEPHALTAVVDGRH